MKKRQNLTTGILLMAAIVVVVNVFSYFYFFRIDLTKDRRYTLSDATLDILSSLKKPVTVTAYYTENSIPVISRARADLKDLLTEYAAHSGNKVVFNFVNPNKNDSLETIARKNGITPFPVQIREKDEMKSVKVYLGAVVKMGDKSDVLPIIDPNTSLEYLLSNSIKKLSIDKKPWLGLLEDNGEPTMDEMSQVNASVSALHAFQAAHLNDSAYLRQYNTVALVDPTDSFTRGQLRQLDGVLARGGGILMTYSGLDPDLRNGVGRLANSGLTQWLASKKIVLDDRYLIDTRCGIVTVPQNMGGMNYNAQISFPFLPQISNFSNNPVTKNLGSIMFPFTTDIRFTGDTSAVKFIPLAYSSSESGLVPAPVRFDISHKWQHSEFPLSNLVVAAAFKGLEGNKDSRLILIANNDFAVNGKEGPNQKQVRLNDDNVNLFSNAVDWLSDNTGLIDLRGKDVKFVPIKDVSDAKKLFLKYFNFLLPILLVLLYGIVRMQVKKRIRTKRMEEII